MYCIHHSLSSSYNYFSNICNSFSIIHKSFIHKYYKFIQEYPLFIEKYLKICFILGIFEIVEIMSSVLVN